jgi:hypothetical protein
VCCVCRVSCPLLVTAVSDTQQIRTVGFACDALLITDAGLHAIRYHGSHELLHRLYSAALCRLENHSSLHFPAPLIIKHLHHWQDCWQSHTDAYVPDFSCACSVPIARHHARRAACTNTSAQLNAAVTTTNPCVQSTYVLNLCIHLLLRLQRPSGTPSRTPTLTP